jgi:hypothetical protein
VGGVIAGSEEGDEAGAAVRGAYEQCSQRLRHGRVDVGKKFHTVTHGDTHSPGEGVIVVTWWHLENAGSRCVERPAAPRPRPRCQAFSVA